MKELAHFFGDSVLQSRTKSQPGSTNIFSQIGKFLYSIADIQSYIDRSLVVIIGLFIVEVKVPSSFHGIKYKYTSFAFQ
ncbi:hypothetical protein RhiirA4_478606 [Rhizophagus irregularis]|uniref:Uncharacterized protein n=1 Tax=Rhizophagus irregularis TaxID=588596 RepID=A0A2I1HF51_9GLOM|nr:hypothetical protein RhiirA4_478606 [Rhizophagus irregularis]